jgi:catalase
VLLQEAFRHCKAIAAWGGGGAVLKSARISSRDPGVEVAKQVDKAFTANLAEALGLHRAWDRAAKVMSSAVPPAA